MGILRNDFRTALAGLALLVLSNPLPAQPAAAETESSGPFSFLPAKWKSSDDLPPPGLVEGRFKVPRFIFARSPVLKSATRGTVRAMRIFDSRISPELEILPTLLMPGDNESDCLGGQFSVMRLQSLYPENPAAMGLVWDAWHRRISQAIVSRFNFFASAAFRGVVTPLTVQVSYKVTADGHIEDINMVQKSSNHLFNILVCQSINSLDGDTELLDFPPGSRLRYIAKYATFVYPTRDYRYSGPDDDVLEYIRRREGHYESLHR